MFDQYPENVRHIGVDLFSSSKRELERWDEPGMISETSAHYLIPSRLGDGLRQLLKARELDPLSTIEEWPPRCAIIS